MKMFRRKPVAGNAAVSAPPSETRRASLSVVLREPRAHPVGGPTDHDDPSRARLFIERRDPALSRTPSEISIPTGHPQQTQIGETAAIIALNDTPEGVAALPLSY